MGISVIAKRMLIIIVVVLAGLIMVSMACFGFPACWTYVWGILLGGILSVVKVLMIDEQVKQMVNLDPELVGRYVITRQFLRYGLTVAVLGMAAYAKNTNLYGAIGGVLTFQVATYLLRNRSMIENCRPTKNL